MTITAVCHSVRVLCPCSGIAPGQPTKLELTLHIAVIHIAPPLNVVCGIGEDADEPDTSKRLHVIVVLIASQDHRN